MASSPDMFVSATSSDQRLPRDKLAASSILSGTARIELLEPAAQSGRRYRKRHQSDSLGSFEASLARNGYRVNPGTGLLAARRRAGYLRRAYPSRGTEQDDQLSSPWPGGPKVRIHLPPAGSRLRT
jgi:hypothetical protein